MRRQGGRRARLVALTFLAFGSFTVGCSRDVAPPSFAPLDTPPRNLIVLVIDTLRRDHVGAYGYPRPITPTLDALAADGVRADGLAPSSWTKASTASLLTGLHPIRHQAFSRNDGIPLEADTLAERLHAQGYRTIGVSANGWVSRGYGFDQGFDDFVYLATLGYDPAYIPAGQVNDQVLARLPPEGAPFFLYVHYIDPHLPYQPATDWEGNPLDAAAGMPARIDQADLDPLNVRPRPASLVARAIDLYDGEVRVADRAVGELLATLRERRYLDDTLIVVASDHGEEFVEHGRMGHGHTLYRETTEVPLIFHAPASFPARTIGMVSLIDVLPTVLDLMNLPAPSARETEDGWSVAEAVARGGSIEPRHRLLHLDFDDGSALASVSSGEKIVLGRYPFKKEIFDLEADPGEHRNLFGQDDEQTLALATALIDRHNHLWTMPLRRRVMSTPSDALNAIRALGYVGAPGEGEHRRIPPVIRVPDDQPDGRLGWADTARPCVVVTDTATDGQLLDGWHRLSGPTDGRWTRPHASMLIGPAATTGRADVTMAGINHRPAPFQLRLSLDGRTVYDAPIPRGPFQVTAGVGELHDAAILRIDASPAFRPSDIGSPDLRVLGTFLQRVCVTVAR